jgi:uncharacterized OsmC-like protein
MAQDSDIRAAQERIIEVFRKRPAMTLSSIAASGHVGQGLACTVRQGDHQATMDMGKTLGGDEAGPTPGFFIRAGLVGCIAIGIKLTAAREGIELDRIDVDVEMDFDDGAMLGLGQNTAAPLETRVTIALSTAAPWDQVTAMVERALAADPYYLALRDAQKVVASVRPKA